MGFSEAKKSVVWREFFEWFYVGGIPATEDVGDTMAARFGAKVSLVSSSGPSSTSLSVLLDDYAWRWPDDEAALQFADFLHQTPHAFERSNSEGHFTGSSWLVSADGERVLLMHHRKLDRWLQLGGHADGDRDLARVALREAGEESGLSDLVVEPAIFDIDRHWIPERGQEPGHWHYDVRYVVRARGSEVFVLNEESLALAWRDVREIADDDTMDISLRRMAGRWLARTRSL
jgi:8-oxo-dGTP pyrophosphatase MutT (NUDIX family)